MLGLERGPGDCYGLSIIFRHSTSEQPHQRYVGSSSLSILSAPETNPEMDAGRYKQLQYGSPLTVRHMLP